MAAAVAPAVARSPQTHLKTRVPPQNLVISTEAMDIVHCAAERPPHFAFALASLVAAALAARLTTLRTEREREGETDKCLSYLSPTEEEKSTDLPQRIFHAALAELPVSASSPLRLNLSDHVKWQNVLDRSTRNSVQLAHPEM
jgi:hypothetical protein